MRDIRSVKDYLHGLEQIKGHFVSTCPVNDNNEHVYSSKMTERLKNVRKSKNKKYNIKATDCR